MGIDTDSVGFVVEPEIVVDAAAAAAPAAAAEDARVLRVAREAALDNVRETRSVEVSSSERNRCTVGPSVTFAANRPAHMGNPVARSCRMHCMEGAVASETLESSAFRSPSPYHPWPKYSSLTFASWQPIVEFRANRTA